MTVEPADRLPLVPLSPCLLSPCPPIAFCFNDVMSAKDAKKQRTDWGNVADWYDQLVGESGSEYQREVVLPGTLKLLNIQPGEKVLDIACGQGVLCRILAERGGEITGVDAARELIRSAVERGPASIHYHVADARELEFLAESHFDAGACMLAIQNIHPL